MKLKLAGAALLAVLMSGCAMQPEEQREALDKCHTMNLDTVVFAYENQIVKVDCSPKPEEIVHLVPVDVPVVKILKTILGYL
ncbi:hypothetical protein BFS86_09035 [Shewanella algae]|nr:hypothetical protein BFS86_09035 [Shewanella algae]